MTEAIIALLGAASGALIAGIVQLMLFRAQRIEAAKARQEATRQALFNRYSNALQTLISIRASLHALQQFADTPEMKERRETAIGRAYALMLAISAVDDQGKIRQLADPLKSTSRSEKDWESMSAEERAKFDDKFRRKLAEKLEKIDETILLIGEIVYPGLPAAKVDHDNS